MGSRFKKRFRLLHVSMTFTEPGTEDQAKHEVIVPRTDVVVDIETEVVDDTKNSLAFLPSAHFHSCEEKNMFILTILKQRLKD